jgi:hypothetical protein
MARASARACGAQAEASDVKPALGKLDLALAINGCTDRLYLYRRRTSAPTASGSTQWEYMRQRRAHPSHICTGTGLTPLTSKS